MSDFDTPNNQPKNNDINTNQNKTTLLSDLLTIPSGNTIIVDERLKIQIKKALDALHFHFKVSQMLKDSSSFKSKNEKKSSHSQNTEEQNKSWNPNLEEKMISLWNQGFCVQEIAQALERSANTIISKMQKTSLINDAAQAHLARYLLRQKIKITNTNKQQWLQIGLENGFDPNFGKKL